MFLLSNYHLSSRYLEFYTLLCLTFFFFLSRGQEQGGGCDAAALFALMFLVISFIVKRRGLVGKE